MPSCHSDSQKPTPFLVLISLSIVARHHPHWLRVGPGEAARLIGVSAERISRLTSRALPLLEAIVASLCRRGRPPAQATRNQDAGELARCRALLDVTQSLLAHLPLQRATVRAAIVGAFKRLKQQHGISQERFCQALSLPARTLRSWLAATPSTQASPTTPPTNEHKKETKKKPRRRRGRFGFDLTLPDTQIGADTTDIMAFGIPLKLIAAQDIGGRDVDLFDAVVVDDKESHAHVIAVMTEALKDLSGAQAITDQGTPYLANVTKAALDALGVEHAPQKEGDPIGKATVERAFRTVKSIAAPLLSLTDAIAERLPALKSAQLAKAATTIVLSAILRAYQHGARAARAAATARGNIDADSLARLAAQSREHARSEERSKRLCLEQIHALYDIKRPLAAFTRALRHYPLDVIKNAERAFRNQVHRDDIKDRASYFSAIVRNTFEQWRANRLRQSDNARDTARRAADLAQFHAQQDAWHDEPVARLLAGLRALAAQWLPDNKSLLADGAGIGRACLRTAFAHLRELYGHALAADTANATFDAFSRAEIDRLGADGLAAIKRVFAQQLAQTALHSADHADQQHVPNNSTAIHCMKQRPPPSVPLRN